MEEKVLEVNAIYDNSGLAEWFGITLGSFKNSKKKKLNELSNYVEFKELKNGKIQILRILDASVPCIYVKKRSEMYMRCKEQVPKVWKKGEPESATRVAHKIQNIVNDTNERRFDSYRKYVSEVRNELWGSPKENTSQCKHVLAKMWKTGGEEYARYELLTEEENQKVQDLYDQMSGDTQDPREQKDRVIMLRYMLEDGSITEAEAWKMMYAPMDYLSFLHAASAMLGCDHLIKATLVYEDAKDGDWKMNFND